MVKERQNYIGEIKRGDIVWVDFDKVIYEDGSKDNSATQKGIRPGIVVQNDVGNHFSGTTQIAPITKVQKKKSQPTHVQLTPAEAPGLTVPSQVLVELTKPVDKTAIKRVTGCVTDSNIINKINTALIVSYGLKDFISSLTGGAAIG